MTSPDTKLPRILIVDDEEAILETMMFTFMDSYDVLTCTDATEALGVLSQNAPIAAVITDQRMPVMTGSEFLARVYEEHPETTRIILTGFADIESTVKAINQGHVYAYINKPWEPEELKQVVKRAVEHHVLITENARLLADLTRAKSFMQAVIDRLDTGAIAIDTSGIVQAANRTAAAFLSMPADPVGSLLDEVMAAKGLEEISATVQRMAEKGGGCFEDVELGVSGVANRVRISLETLSDGAGDPFGRVILFKEVSHEPLRMRLEETIAALLQHDSDLRPELEKTLDLLEVLATDVRGSGITSPAMTELTERVSRGRTALQNWLDVDDALAREDYPDAQLLRDRMRVAEQRWPAGQELPQRVKALADRVELYYESGENSKQRVL